MGKGSKLKGSEIIPAQTEIEDALIRFSFNHIDLLSDDHFSISDTDSNYTSNLLERLRAINGMRLSEFRTKFDKALRNHPITWSETIKPEGFSHLPQQLQDIEAWQFQISVNEHGRVHGFFIDSTFYVVWLDPNHNLYE